MKFSAVQLFALGVAVAAEATGRSRIVPELEPVSDKKFMKSDLPDDRRPRVYHKFQYPYPIVDDSEDYDADYVEDKNDDGGYWSAQMKYDALKNKLTKEVDELKDALRNLQRKKLVLDTIAKREEKAEEAEAAEKKADGLHDDATNGLNNAKKGVDGAADGVDDETMDLEECKKQLQKAREDLKKLLAEKDADAKKLAELAKAEADAEAAEVGAEKDEEGAEKSVEEEKADVVKAEGEYKKELADVKVAEDKLATQAIELRKFRHADPDGGVYEVGKKSLLGRSQSVRLSLMALLGTAALLNLS